MNRSNIICVLLALASPALYAQNANSPQPDHQAPNAQSQYNMQQNDMRMRQQHDANLANTDRQVSINSLANLTKLRAKLAEAWQKLGMSPQAAQTVANAYQPNFSLNSRRISLEGRSDQEIAQILQSSLAKKDYLAANQALIDYETGHLKLGTDTSPDGHHN